MLSVLLLVVMTVFAAGCKKRTAFNEENAQEAIDVTMFRAETDAVLVEVNNVSSNRFLMRGKGLSADEAEGVATATLCGGTIDSSQLSSGILKINYNNVSCNNRSRSGQVVISIVDYPLKKWKNRNCILKVDFKGFIVRGLTDGRSMQVDGTFYLTNETGSTWYEMRYLNEPTIGHLVSANDVKVTFDAKEIVYLNLKRRYTYTIAGGVISCREEGLGEQNGLTSLETWGGNRDGKTFSSQVIVPLVWNTSCGAGFPSGGQLQVVTDGNYFDLNVFYGLDSGGESVSSGCASAWKATWDYKRKTNKRILQYTR